MQMRKAHYKNEFSPAMLLKKGAIDDDEEDADVNALDGFEWFDEDDDEFDELDEVDIESGRAWIVLRRTVGDDEEEREHFEVDENCFVQVPFDLQVGGDSVVVWKCLYICVT